MPNPSAEPRLVALPVLGVDQGSVYAQQPEGTCPDLRNVRPMDVRDRVGIGKRFGHSKAFSTLIGSDSVTNGRRVNHLAGYVQAGVTPSAEGGTLVPFADDYTTLATGQRAASTNTVAIRMGNNNGVAVHIEPEIGGSSVPTTGTCLGIGSDASSGANVFLPSRYGTTNNISATFVAQGVQQGLAGTAVANGCQWLGVFIRGTPRLNSCIAAVLVRTAATTVRLDIIAWPSYTALASSASLDINNVATWYNDLTLTIREDGDLITATAQWPSMVATDSDWNGVTVTTTTTTNAGNLRGGLGFFCPSSVTPPTTTIAGSPFRFVRSMSGTNIVPDTSALITSMLGTSTSSGSRYLVPAGFTSVHRDNTALTSTAAVISTIAGEQSSASRTLTFAEIPVVDTDASVKRVLSGPRNGTNERHYCVMTTDPGVEYGIRWRFPGTAANEFGCGVVIRCSNNFRNFIRLGFDSHLTTSDEIATGSVGLATLSGNDDATAEYFVNGERTVVETAHDSSVSGAVVARTDDVFTWVVSTSAITLNVNGLTMFTYSLNAGAAASVGTATRVGFTSGAQTADRNMYGAEWVVTGVTGGVSVGDATMNVLAFTRGAVYGGNLETGTLSQFVAGGFDSQIISTSVLSSRVYAVDGLVSKVINPALSTVGTWTATRGTLPARCRLVCTYRGRIVLARQDTNPSVWFASRTLDALDWEFGAAPLSTAAVAGNNSDVGQPADTITALIPFSDDYLIFGCGSSIWVLEGDPGYGGQIQNASYQTGVAGARSWCFTDDATLYFLGNAGLWKMPRGSLQPNPVSGRRLKTLLDRTNFDTTLVQMAFNSFRNEVMIFLTPTDGTSQGTHICYDVENDAFFIDQYPLAFGPWSVLQTVGIEDQDRQYLIGGNDGYVRRPDDDSFSDDGTAISSYVRFAPTESAAGLVEQMVVEIQAEGSSNSSAVNWYLLGASSPEELKDQTTVTALASGTWFNGPTGFQAVQRVRETAAAHQMYISQSSSSGGFSIERIKLLVVPGARRRLSL